MMRLADPWMLLLLLLIVPIVWLTRRSGGRIRYSSIEGLKNLTMRSRLHPRMLLTALRVLVIALFVVAMARPQAGKVYSEVRSEGVDIFLILDTSGSMQAMDFKVEGKPVQRVEIVKSVVADFVKKRPNDRMGIVVFAEEAFTQCPLTLDHGILLDFLKEVQSGMAGDSTAIGSAIGTGVNRMKNLQAKERIMILLTDGRSNTGRIPPAKAVELAETYHIKIYTIGVGTHGKAPFLVDTIFGKQYVYQDVDIDEDTLKMVATKTGGKYYRATDTEELDQIYSDIDKLEKTETKLKEYTEYAELFHWALLPGLLLLMLEIGLAHTRLRKIP